MHSSYFSHKNLAVKYIFDEIFCVYGFGLHLFSAELTFVFLIGIKSKNVKIIAVPQYEGLALKDISQFCALNHPEVGDYLPDQQEIHKAPKDWICNVIFSVVGSPFTDWVKLQVEVRN